MSEYHIPRSWRAGIGHLREVVANPLTISRKIFNLIEKRNLRPGLNLLKGKKDVVGVEVGTFLGENACVILKKLNIKKLYLVDPYKAYKSFTTYNDQQYMDKIEKQAHKRLRRFDKKIFWIKSELNSILEPIKDNSLDFAYIDGDHSYQACINDLRNVLSKVRRGGLIAGHDYRPHISGRVADATSEFCKQHGFQLQNQGIHYWIWIK